MRENRVDSPYLFLHRSFSIVASLAHTEKNFLVNYKVMDVHERKPSGFTLFVSTLRL